MEQEEQEPGRLHFVGKTEELIKAKQTFATLEGRDVLIIHHQGDFYAMDSYCYHAGAALQSGDIEELDGKLCIVCPNHKYKISLCAGEGLYKGPNPKKDPSGPVYLSKGVKQRVHTVTETDGALYVQLSSQPGWIESDYFQGEKGKENRAKAAAAADKETS